MIPILLRIGPITIYSYGFMVALAFIVGDRLVTSEFKRGYDAGLASTLVVWVGDSLIRGRPSERRYRQLAYLFSGPQKHHLFKHGVCLLRRLHRGIAGQHCVRASVPNPLADACRHV